MLFASISLPLALISLPLFPLFFFFFRREKKIEIACFLEQQQIILLHSIDWLFQNETVSARKLKQIGLQFILV